MVNKNLMATLLFFTTSPTRRNNQRARFHPNKLQRYSISRPLLQVSRCLRLRRSRQSGEANKLAIKVAISEAKSTVVCLSKFSHSAEEVKNCVSYVKDAIDSMRDSLQTLRTITRGGVVAAAPSPSADTFSFKMDDVLTNMSAALTYEETCTDQYDEEEVEGEGDIKKTIIDRVNNLKRFSSNVLALANSYANNGAQ